MKKGMIFFVIFAIIITISLYGLQNFQYTTEDDGTKVKININKEKKIDLNKFMDFYKENEFEKVDINNGNEIKGYILKSQGPIQSMTFRNGIIQKDYEVYLTHKPTDTSINDLGFVLTGSTPINVDYKEESVVGKVFVESILPLIFFVIVFILLLKLFSPKGGAGFPFGTQAGKLRTKADVKTNFGDVAGMEEAKNELQEIVDYLKNPDKYKKAGARVPKGVLLYGPPGSGKTLLARAVAGEAGVTFFSASGSEFMEMLVGMGAAKVRELFNKAKAASPAIIFIDEIDTIGRKRGQGYSGGHQEQEQTLNQILTEMDGFEKDINVIIIAATNRPDILDSALLRAGRFDRKVYVGRPTLEERKMIIELHSKGKKLAKNIDIESLARRTSGFVGADLENIMNEAALKAAKEDRKQIESEDLEYALEKIVMGPEKKIKSIKEKEREIIAYHELGHAVTTFELPNADPVEKISIVSRGMALGVTWMMPQEDRYLYSKAKFLDELVTILGGRAAEEIFFGKDEITTGASNDFEKATKIASDMLLKYGMDEDLGTIKYFDHNSGDFQPFKPYSEHTAEIIDQKVKNLTLIAYNKALAIIKKRKKTIEKLAFILLDKEFLTKEEFETYMTDQKKADKTIEEIRKKPKGVATLTTPVKKTTKNKLNNDKDKNISDKQKKEDSPTNEDNKTDNLKNKLEDLLDRFLPKKK